MSPHLGQLFLELVEGLRALMEVCQVAHQVLKVGSEASGEHGMEFVSDTPVAKKTCRNCKR